MRRIIYNMACTALLAGCLTACSDYLDVDAPSQYTDEYIFSSETEIDRALNGVYTKLLDGNTIGAYITDFCFNSDVDFATNSSEAATNNGFKRFECTSDASKLSSVWTASYAGLEACNQFIYNLENSDLYKAEVEADDDEENTLRQMMGEAKVIRAIFCHEMMDVWGDIPFTFTPTYYKDDFVTPVVSRDEVRQTLIDDLKGIAPYMSFAADMGDGVERVSKEACWAMIARMALTAGGYSLRPDTSNPSFRGTMERPSNYKEFYQTALDYCDSVITSGTHALTKDFQSVFVDECNYLVANSDDPIFELPYAKDASGNIGYAQGPKIDLYEGSTTGKNIWGRIYGSQQLNAFYRYAFDDADLRRDYLNGLWYYEYDGTPDIYSSYTVYNNKWAKLWCTTGDPTSEGNTGINYPYLRYADVLLMYAEASNEINDGPTEEAKAAVKEVRGRAFSSDNYAEKVEAYVDAATDKESFLKVVLDERKLEFAGENMRWKDLVRNNMYAQELYWTFQNYFQVGLNAGGTAPLIDAVEEHYGMSEGRLSLDLPFTMYYKVIANDQTTVPYPNTVLDVIQIANPYHNLQRKPSGTWETSDCYQWFSESTSTPTAQCLYSLYGFIRGDELGRELMVNNNGQLVNLDANNLPVVRYILPYPQSAIQRAGGAYTNYYGYSN